MPDRLDHVTVATSRGDISIPWTSRNELLNEIRPRTNGVPVTRAFEAVGATRPVELENAGKLLVIQTIDLMIADAGGAEHLPEGLVTLQNSLIGDLRDAGK